MKAAKKVKTEEMKIDAMLRVRRRFWASQLRVEGWLNVVVCLWSGAFLGPRESIHLRTLLARYFHLKNASFCMILT